MHIYIYIYYLNYVKLLNHLEGKQSTCGEIFAYLEYWFTFQVGLFLMVYFGGFFIVKP